MEQVYSRRVQRTGRATLTVSLPHEWARRMGIHPHDEVYLIEEPTGALVVWPSSLNGRGLGREVSLRVVGDEGPEEVFRLYLSLYIAGFSVIKIEFGDAGYRHTRDLKEMMRTWLVGVEIVNESLHGLTTQCLPAHESLQPLKAIERMADIATSMQRDALYSIESGDEALAEDIVQRDFDVDRFYHFVVRQLNIGILSPRSLAYLGLKNPQECLSYIIAAKAIERAADHAASMAGFIARAGHPRRPPARLIEAGYEASDIFTEAKVALLRVDATKAREVMRRVEAFKHKMRDMAAKEEPLRGDASIHALGENIRRIVEYSSDICEVAMNLSANHMSF